MTTDSFVRFDTNFGAFTLELYNGIAPLTVANFLSYVGKGSYNGSFFHRLVAGFVLQGGGYTYDSVTGPTAIPTSSPVANEFSPSYPDVERTIAMAKLGGNPNSATDQFFFNLGDNSSSLGTSQNGGFTVFGRVVQGWDVVQTIAALPTTNAGSPFDQLPVHNLTGGTVTAANLVLLNDIVGVTAATYLWQGGSGDWGQAANWGLAGPATGAHLAANPPSTSDVAAFEGSGGTIGGTGGAGQIAFDNGAWSLTGLLSASGAISVGAGSSTVTLAIANGGAVQTQNATVASAATLTIDGQSHLTVTGTATVDGTIASAGTLTVGTIAGSGRFSLNGGTVNMSGNSGILHVQSLSGATSVNGIAFGSGIDLASVKGAALNGNVVTAGGASLTLAPAPSGYVYKLYGDASQGTDVLLNPVSDPAGAISYTDATANTTGTAGGTNYTGPVDYLQRQYIWSGPGHDSLAIRANVSNAFLKGAGGDDALQALAGNNVLDGGPGSNFLIGGNGADGGRDTFYVDARDPATVTWSTIVNFHQGDQATIFGFHPNLSTRPYTANDGVTGFQGVTIHAEIGGAGTGVNASMTFAGIDQATANTHFTITTGSLPNGASPAIDYMLIQYT